MDGTITVLVFAVCAVIFLMFLGYITGMWKHIPGSSKYPDESSDTTDVKPNDPEVTEVVETTEDAGTTEVVTNDGDNESSTEVEVVDTSDDNAEVDTTETDVTESETTEATVTESDNTESADTKEETNVVESDVKAEVETTEVPEAEVTKDAEVVKEEKTEASDSSIDELSIEKNCDDELTEDLMHQLYNDLDPVMETDHSSSVHSSSTLFNIPIKYIKQKNLNFIAKREITKDVTLISLKPKNNNSNFLYNNKIKHNRLL